MNEKTRIQIEEMKKQTIGVEVEMYNITREKAARTIAEYFHTEGTVKYIGGSYMLSVKLDAPVPCRLDAPDLDFACRASADCLHQHLQVI